VEKGAGDPCCHAQPDTANKVKREAKGRIGPAQTCAAEPEYRHNNCEVCSHLTSVKRWPDKVCGSKLTEKVWLRRARRPLRAVVGPSTPHPG
jgi:hypothetical protein